MGTEPGAPRLRGGCFCGLIRYEAAGPVRDETVCHCETCRRTAGAPLVAWVTVDREGFRLAGTEPTRFRSSDHATRTFCPRCGTSLTFEADELPDEIDLSTATLDDPEAHPPRDQIWTSRRLRWLDDLERLPRHAQEREG